MEFEREKISLTKNCELYRLIFWIIFFFDGVSSTTKTVEVIRDFDEFDLRRGGGSSNGEYKKIITDVRDFTTYANENSFFTCDTIELKITPAFGLVEEYRQYPPRDSKIWINHRLSAHNNPVLIAVSIILFLMTIGAVFFDLKNEKFKALSLFTIAGAFIFFMSLVT